MASLNAMIYYKHNKIQLHAQYGQMQHLHLYSDMMVPESKEMLHTKFNIMMPGYMTSVTKDPEPVVNPTRIKAALKRVYTGGYTTEVMIHEKI